MEKVRVRAAVLVFLQFLMLFALLLTTLRTVHVFSGILFCLTSVALVGWAIYTMRKSRFRISPVPHTEAVLVTDGPYRWLRHPMYTAILLAVGGLLLFDCNAFRVMYAVVLLVVLIMKLHWEEEMLAEKFPAFGEYRRHTWRLIPILY